MHDIPFLDGIILLKRTRDKFCRTILETYDLRVSDMDVLLFLANHPGPHTAKDICNVCRMPKSLASQSVETLCARGLIHRDTDSRDKRRIQLTLLPPADEILTAMQARIDEFTRIVSEGIDEADAVAIRRAFEIIHRNMNRLNGAN